MNNFTFNIPTDIRFGKGQISCLSAELKKFGSKVLLAYGGGSIKKSGIYNKVLEQIKPDYEVFELSGIEPNPKLTSVVEGARICKENGIDVILAVGGGSVIDCSKHIAAASYYDGNPWDLVMDRSLVKKALPVAVVLTVCATGSEMNSGAVITNQETNEKLEINSPLLYPRLSICDPTYLFTLPPKQTAAGAMDIVSHVMEQYFQPNNEAYITDTMSEAVLKTALKYGPVALNEPENYEARSNLMWASTVALNHLLTVGKGGSWSVHPIEHVVSAYYDLTHGLGLSILTPAWMKYVLSDDTSARFARFAREVFGVEDEDDMEAAGLGIEALEKWIKIMGLPLRFSEVGINSDKFEHMAYEAVRTSGLSSRSYVILTEKGVNDIFELCK